MRRTSSLCAILMVPVLLAVIAVGYYKFILPDGVAAYVNGEEITLFELDAAVAKARAAQNGYPVRDDGHSLGMLRYQVLDRLIVERIALQEARRAGLGVSAAELADARRGLKAASGFDEAAFEASVSGRYGSPAAFEQQLERDILIRKFVAGCVIPRDADAAQARIARDRWLRALSRNASVRIALAEQWSATGCCCGNGSMARGACAHKHE